MIAPLALRYLLIFAIILAALSVGAYEFLSREYASLLQPAIGTPEAAIAYRSAMTRVGLTILAFDIPLLVIVGIASYLLARASLGPLIAARERERAFAADAAHGLRSPLATIGSVAQAAIHDADPHSAAAFKTIARAALDASDLVGELLTLSRAAESSVLRCEPVDLGAVVSAASNEFQTLADGRALRFNARPESAIVDGDEPRLREVARNLLENALRHARSTVTIGSCRNGEHAELTVSNDGDPIAPEMRDRVFERFYRGESHPEGTGLGLAIVRWIAQAHGGEAFVRESRTGETEFVVRLPLFNSAK